MNAGSSFVAFANTHYTGSENKPVTYLEHENQNSVFLKTVSLSQLQFNRTSPRVNVFVPAHFYLAKKLCVFKIKEMAKISTRADDGDKHSLDVTCLLFHQNKLFSAADDGKIKLWQDDLKLLGQVDAHPCSVFSLATSDDTLYSCSNEGTVKAWTLDLKEKSTVHKEECEFWKLCFANGLLYVGDDQGVVRLFHKDQLHSLVNILEPVKDMFVSDNLIYTCRDLDLVITEMCQDHKERFVTKKTMPGRAPFNVVGDKIFISSRGGKDIVLYENGGDYKQLTEIKDAHLMIINALCSVKTTDKLVLYSGGWDKVLKQWVVEGNVIKLVNECPVDMCINSLMPGPKGEIYAGGSDGHIIRIDV